MKNENIEDIKTLVSNEILDWGTKLDFVKNVPTEYAGKTFYEMNHDDIKSFFDMNNVEKFKMAYWIERYQSKHAGRIGFVLGIVVGTVVGIVLYAILKNIL